MGLFGRDASIAIPAMSEPDQAARVNSAFPKLAWLKPTAFPRGWFQEAEAALPEDRSVKSNFLFK